MGHRVFSKMPSSESFPALHTDNLYGIQPVYNQVWFPWPFLKVIEASEKAVKKGSGIIIYVWADCAFCCIVPCQRREWKSVGRCGFRPPAPPPKPKKRRIGRTPPVGQPKLFGGSLEEYIEVGS